ALSLRYPPATRRGRGQSSSAYQRTAFLRRCGAVSPGPSRWVLSRRDDAMQHLLNSATERKDLSLQPITQRKGRSLLRIGVAAAVALLFAIALPKSEAGPLRVVPTRAVRAPVAMYSFSPYPGVVRPNPVAQTIAVQQATVRAMLYQEAIR